MKITVSPRILESATQFFEVSLRSIYVELLQNARRAGATRVDVNTSAIDQNTVSITVEDNGFGMFRQGVNLQLGLSNWSEEVLENENPAGCGLFCLSRLGCTIESNGYQVILTPEAFKGKEEVEVTSLVSYPKISYTKITFTYPSHPLSDYVYEALKEVSRHYPIDVYLNSVLLYRSGYLDLFDYIVSYPDYTIGFSTTLSNNKNCLSNLNYFGKVVYLPSPDGYVTLVRVDLKSGKLKLTLPQRNSIVQDESYHQLIKDIRREYYKFLGTLSILPPEINDQDELLALEYGVDLSPLRQFSLVYKPTHYGFGTFTIHVEQLNTMTVFSEVDNELEVYFTNAVSTKKYYILPDPTIHLKRECKDFQVQALVNDNWLPVTEVEDTWVDKFRVSYTIVEKDPGKIYPKLDILDIDFFAVFDEAYPTTYFNGRLLLRKGCKAIDPNEIAEVVTEIGFESSGEGDYEEEREEYCHTVASMAERILGNHNAERIYKFSTVVEAVCPEIRRLLKDGEQIIIDNKGWVYRDVTST